MNFGGLKIVNLGLRDYQEIWEFQKELVELRSLPEVFMETAEAALGKAIHIMNPLKRK